MNVIAALELVGLAACGVGIFFTLRANRTLGADARITLVALFVTLALAHVFDVVQWTANADVDRYGDVLKILTPAVWLFFLFVVTRERLSGQVSEQRAQLDFFFEEAPLAVAVVDDQQRYVACSQRWLSVHDLEPCAPGTPLEEAPARWGPTWARLSRQSLTKGETLRGLERFNDDEGEAWCEWIARPWHRRGVGSGTVIVVEQATERIQEQKKREALRERLIRAQDMEMVGQIASGVAHDMKNVLHVIGMHADMLEQDRASDPMVVESTEAIHEAVATAAGMAQWLLSFGRNRERKYEKVDLNKAAERMANLSRPALPPDQCLLHEGSDRPVWIQADSTLLEQLIINLVLNARDAMPDGGTITLCVQDTVSGPALSVTDEGRGIPDELRERITEPFFTTKGAKGTGLGLSVVSRAVSAHGARLAIDSQVDEGSTFAITFPDLARFDPQEVEKASKSFRYWETPRQDQPEERDESHARIATSGIHNRLKDASR